MSSNSPVNPCQPMNISAQPRIEHIIHVYIQMYIKVNKHVLCAGCRV